MQPSKVLQCLRSTALPGGSMSPTDEELLESFINRRDSVALDALIRRYSPLVWGVCGRILHDHHDAEDAFQATFLVLVRKVASISRRELIGNWIYGVARQTALKARVTKAKRKTREIAQMATGEPTAREQKLWDDLEPVLDEELGLLPEKYRQVIVLCDLEGKTRQEAAISLKCPEGTIGSRLARARSMLAGRLTRRGLTVPGLMLSAMLAEKSAASSVPGTVVASTIAAAALSATGQVGTSGAISARVTALTEKVLKAMLLKKLKVVASLLVVAAIVVLAAASLPLRNELAAEEDRPKTEPSTVHVLAPVPKNEAKVELVLQTGHTGAIASACFSPDGKRIVTASSDHLAIIWDAASRRKLRSLQGHASGVDCAEYSPDGKWIVTVSAGDNTVIVWDAESGQKHRRFQEPAEAQRQPFGNTMNNTMLDARATFSPDGKRVMATLRSADDRGGQVFNIVVWELDSSRKVFTLSARNPSFINDGKQILTAGNGEAVVWDAQTGEKLRTFGKNEDLALTASCSPDGKRIVTACLDDPRSTQGGLVNIWDVETGKKLRSIARGVKAGREQHSRLMARFSPDGKQIVTIDRDSQSPVILWNAETGEKLRELVAVSAGGRLTTSMKSASYSHDGKHLVTTSGDGLADGYQVVVWDAETGKKISDLPQYFNLNGASFSPNGKHFAITSMSNVSVWDVEAGGKVNPRRFGAFGGYAAFRADGKQLLEYPNSNLVSFAYNERNSVVIWDVETGQRLRSFSGSFACFRPDGKSIISVTTNATNGRGSGGAGFGGGGTNDWQITVWNAETGERLRSFSDSVENASFSPDGTRIVVTFTVRPNRLNPGGGPKKKNAVSPPETAVVLDFENGNKVLSLIGHSGAVKSARYSPDGKQIVTASADDTAIVWNAETGAKIRRLDGHIEAIAHEGHVKAIGHAEFSPNGKRIVTASDDHTGIVWNAETGARICTLTGHTAAVLTANYSPDGKQIITASNDGTTRFWDAETGKELCALITMPQFNEAMKQNNGVLRLEKDWLVVTPEGLYDGSEVGRKRVAFRTDGKLDVETGERYEKEYYRPGLLHKILSGK
jgi:RNA polymerase sigma factor (sigma-70 family)